jgi:hypothetical protein
MITIISIAFVTGIFVKVADQTKGCLDMVFGLFYGFLIGAMISQYPVIAPLWLGVVIGNIMAAKFDKPGHILSLPVIVVTVLFLGYGEMDAWLAILFIAMAFLEEKLHDLSEKKKKLKIFRYRPLVEVTALAVSIFSGNYELIIAIASLDLGYLIADYATKKTT